MMGLMDIVGGLLGGSQVGANQAGGQSAQLINVLTSLLSNSGTTGAQSATQGANANMAGGLGNLINLFEQSGLSSQVQSWIGTGANQPVASNDIMKVFGDSKISQIAQQLGVNPQVASEQIANHLPNFLDKLTPNGQVPSHLDLGQLQNLASQFLGGTQKA